jgi:glycosyltransferase involved in cell wall biosynthesis
VRVVHISTFHQPLDVRIFQKECRTLARAGHEVHLIIRDPKDSERDGVRFHAVARNDDQGKAGRIWSRLSGAYRIARSLKAELYHFHDPELIPVGLLLRLRGHKVLYDVHENAPDEALSLYHHSPVKAQVRSKMLAVLDALAMRFLSGFVCATPAIARRFPSKRTELVQNFPIQSEYVLPAEAIPYAERPLQIIYTGILSTIRSIREIVGAMALLPESLSSARLVLAGTFESPALEEEVRQMPGWERVDYLGWQSREQVAQLLAASRVGLVLYYPLRDHLEAQPNKLFEYMAAGIPSVASNFPFWREIVDSVCGGQVADPEDSASIAQAITWLLEHPEKAEAMGKRGQEAVRKRFNWEQEARKLLDFYEGLSPSAVGLAAKPKP